MQAFKDFLNKFADEQRLERLSQCLQIERALDECERISKVNASKKLGEPLEEPTISLQDTRPGMKISRFYGWGLQNPRAQQAIDAMRANSGVSGSLVAISDDTKSTTTGGKGNNNTNKNNGNQKDGILLKTTNDNSPLSCSKEIHALWGCRALSVRCGPQLIDLKECFETKLGTTNPQYFAYEDSSDVEKDSFDDKCRQSMRELGHCVLKNTKELQERTG